MRKDNFRLLVVDDEEDIILCTENYFKRRGFDVFSATNADDAVMLTKERKLDIIFLDIKLSLDKSGIDVLKEIRKFDKNVFILIVTGQKKLSHQDVALIFGEGVEDLIEKPIALEELYRKTLEILGGGHEVDISSLLSKKISIEKTKKIEKVEGREIIHKLANIYNDIRPSCERFILDYKDGFLEGASKEEILKRAIKIMEKNINAVDAAVIAAEKIMDL